MSIMKLIERPINVFSYEQLKVDLGRRTSILNIDAQFLSISVDGV